MIQVTNLLWKYFYKFISDSVPPTIHPFAFQGRTTSSLEGQAHLVVGEKNSNLRSQSRKTKILFSVSNFKINYMIVNIAKLFKQQL